MCKRHLVIAGLAVLLVGGCHVAASPSSPQQPLGKRVAPSAPPAPRDPYFELRPGEVFVAGRWAWTGDQWMWQPGHHEPAREGEVYVAGRWDRRDGAFRWIDGGWRPARAGYVFVPGHWDFRGTQFVWILDEWQPQVAGVAWIEGRWTEGAGGKVFVDGHWASAPAAVPAKRKDKLTRADEGRRRK